MVCEHGVTQRRHACVALVVRFLLWGTPLRHAMECTALAGSHAVVAQAAVVAGGQTAWSLHITV